HLNGGTKLLEDLKERSEPLGKNISLKPIFCLGQCDRAPAICLNDVIYPNMTPDDAEALISTAMAGFELAAAAAVPVTVKLESNIYGDGPKYGVLRKLVEARDWDGVIGSLKAAVLFGMGGAGFPTGVKWDVVRAAPGPIKYVVCNADESEPGTIK